MRARGSGRRLYDAGPIGVAVLALGVLAAVLLVVAELSPVLEITVDGRACRLADPELADQCAPTGASRHLGGLALLGLLALAMAWGAGVGGSRPASFALVAAGAAVLAIVLLIDLPDVGETGQIGVLFEAAAAAPGSGFWLSLAGGVAALAAGALGLVNARR
jgi:hypothetical protein